MAFAEPPGWYVISLRPQGGHASLRRAAAAHGARLIALSPWRVTLRSDDQARLALARALSAPRLLFTSPNAVRAAAALLPLARKPGQIWITVGGGTAAALQKSGIDGVDFPSRMDSEGLLALPVLKDLQGIRIGLVTAPKAARSSRRHCANAAPKSCARMSMRANRSRCRRRRCASCVRSTRPPRWR